MTTALAPEDRRRVQERINRDPAWFARNFLGVEPYPKQVEILESVRDHVQTSVCGANGTGKDWTTGRIVIPWWMASHAYPCEKCDPGGVISARLKAEGRDWSPLVEVVVMAPTHRQISEIIWRELRFAYSNSLYPLGGRMLPSDAKWDVSNGALGFAQGFSTDRAWNITGFHSPHLLVVISEAHNFPEDAFVAVKRLQSERLLLSFNAFSQSGEAFDSHHSKRHLYNPIVISAYDSPNVKGGNALVPGVVTQADIDGYAADWGEDSPYFRSTVLAEFAETEDGLLPLSWLTAAQERQGVDVRGGELVAGIDVAGPGEDETVLTIRHRESILLQKSWRMPDPRGEVIAALEPYKIRLRSVNIDSNGLGYGFALHMQDQGLPVRFVNVGEAPYDSEHFANLKAELYWGLRLRLKGGDLAGLPAEAVGQLASLRYGHNARGQVQIEKKEDARKRGIKSPDKAESIMLAFAYGDGVGSSASLIERLMEPETVARDPHDYAARAEANRRADDRRQGDTIVRERDF